MNEDLNVDFVDVALLVEVALTWSMCTSKPIHFHSFSVNNIAGFATKSLEDN